MVKNQTPSLIKVNYWFILTLIINLLAPLTNVAFAWSLKYLIDDGVQQRLQPLYRHLLICLGIVMSFVIMHYLAQYLSNICRKTASNLPSTVNAENFTFGLCPI